MKLFLRLAIVLLVRLAVDAGEAARPRPNFLIILADDLGFSDLGCYGGEIATPNLDQLANNGLRFTQFYNTARCWPTRGALLTGYYPQAIRRDALPNGKGGSAGVRPAWARLLPEHLRALGYRSYHSGKWHVDGPRLAGGFDRSYSLEDHDRNFHPRLHYEDDVKLPPVARGGDHYSSTAIADHALKCLREHAAHFPERPFFHYLAFTVPHFPLQAPAADIAKYRDRYFAGWDKLRGERARKLRRLGLVRGNLPPIEADVFPAWNPTEAALREKVGPGEVGRAVPWLSLTPEQQRFQATKMAIHAAMVDRMDQEIGRVLTQLRTMGALDNTVVMFLSDNGASAEQLIRGDGHDPAAAPGSAGTFLGLGPGWSSAANAPFRKHKSWVHEGGIATPFIVHWPAGLRARGELRQAPAHVVDLAPTLLELAGGAWPARWNGVTVPPSHGTSLVPALARDRSLPRGSLWWLHEGHRAIRVGDWKLVASKSGGTLGDWELYDLKRDRTETHNLAARHPNKVRELAAEWERRTTEFQRLAAD
jgi:arylsulfatase A-like enzyme